MEEVSVFGISILFCGKMDICVGVRKSLSLVSIMAILFKGIKREKQGIGWERIG